MAQVSELLTSNCLVWDTERPYSDVWRRSSNFSLLGYEWYFVLFYDKYYGYYITLNRVTGEKLPETDFKITTFVYGQDSSNCLYKIHTWKRGDRVIWKYSYDTIVKTIQSGNLGGGKWRVIFFIDAPFTLQHPRIETAHNPPEIATASEVTSAADSGNFPRASTHVDKCVQVSTLDILPDLESLSHDYCQLLENKRFPDVQLRCGGSSIRAHRSILASRSDVFAAMFQTKMAEGETGIVDVKDMDAEVLDLLLEYVYSGRIPELSEDTAPGLYAAGDKYSIRALKKTCSDRMVGGLTEKNCLRFLTLADAHGDEGFKDRVVSFVAENLEALEKHAWSEFSEKHSGLAVSVYQRYNASTLSKQA